MSSDAEISFSKEEVNHMLVTLNAIYDEIAFEDVVAGITTSITSKAMDLICLIESKL